jgi:hypothetical protein
MAQPYNPEATKKRISKFKSELDLFTNILYKGDYVPSSFYTRDKLYSVFRAITEWLKWQETEHTTESVYNGVKAAIKRDAAAYGINSTLSRNTFCALLHQGEITDKLIDGTYHLAEAPATDFDTIGYNTAQNFVYNLVIQDADGNQVGECRWTNCRPRKEGDVVQNADILPLCTDMPSFDELRQYEENHKPSMAELF